MANELKLAREATLLHTRWSSMMDDLRKTAGMETCIICLEVTWSEKMFSVDDCFHRFCLSCIKWHAKTELLKWGGPVECPGAGCKTELNIDGCGKFLGPEIIDIMRQRQKEASIPANEKVYCPYPRCSFLMSKTEVLEYTNKCYGGGLPSPRGARKCMKCLSYLCMDCKTPWHYGMDCQGYKASNSYQSTEDGKLHALACAEQWRQCRNCNNMVVVVDGCRHTRCRCGHEFCYRCGATWNDRTTCRCSVWDELDFEEETLLPGED